MCRAENTLARIPAVLSGVVVPEFVPKKGVKIATTEAEAKSLRVEVQKMRTR